MKKQLFIGASAALLLTACSNDDVVSMVQDGIRYNVTAMNQTRAADSYCNAELPGSFKVWAMTNDNQLYIDGDLISRQNGVWNDENGVRYWPNGKTLDFYAEVNGDNEFNFNNGAPTFNNFQVKPTVADQLDLMYAVAKGVDRNSNQNAVAVNFRHALSQVCFKARNDSKTLKVVVNGVSAGHLSDQGTFTFPTESTSNNYQHPDHGDSQDPNAPSLNGGTWDVIDNPVNQYDVTGLNVTLEPSSAVANLTAPEDNHQNGFVNVMTLMPQQQNGWDPTQKAPTYNGSYFKLDVAIYNVSGETETAVYTGKCVIPVTIDWKQGYRYIYTLIFDEGGNGGWTDTPENPQPVLAGIKYDVTVDDFIPVNGDNHMNGDGQDPAVKENVWTVSAYDGENLIGTQNVRSTNETVTYSFGGLPTPVKEGYEFKGWSTTADGDPVASVNLTKDNLNVSIYAVWEEVKKPEYTYKIHFVSDLEDASGMPADITVVSESTTFSYTLPSTANAPQSGLENLNCHGWSTTANSTEVEYANGAKVELTSDNPEITLHAVWKPGNPAGSGTDMPGIDPTQRP